MAATITQYEQEVSDCYDAIAKNGIVTYLEMRSMLQYAAGAARLDLETIIKDMKEHKVLFTQRKPFLQYILHTMYHINQNTTTTPASIPFSHIMLTMKRRSHLKTFAEYYLKKKVAGAELVRPVVQTTRTSSGSTCPSHGGESTRTPNRRNSPNSNTTSHIDNTNSSSSSNNSHIIHNNNSNNSRSDSMHHLNTNTTSDTDKTTTNSNHNSHIKNSYDDNTNNNSSRSDHNSHLNYTNNTNTNHSSTCSHNNGTNSRTDTNTKSSYTTNHHDMKTGRSRTANGNTSQHCTRRGHRTRMQCSNLQLKNPSSTKVVVLAENSGKGIDCDRMHGVVASTNETQDIDTIQRLRKLPHLYQDVYTYCFHASKRIIERHCLGLSKQRVKVTGSKYFCLIISMDNGHRVVASRYCVPTPTPTPVATKSTTHCADHCQYDLKALQYFLPPTGRRRNSLIIENIPDMMSGLVEVVATSKPTSQDKVRIGGGGEGDDRELILQSATSSLQMEHLPISLPAQTTSLHYMNGVICFISTGGHLFTWGAEISSNVPHVAQPHFTCYFPTKDDMQALDVAQFLSMKGFEKGTYEYTQYTAQEEFVQSKTQQQQRRQSITGLPTAIPTPTNSATTTTTTTMTTTTASSKPPVCSYWYEMKLRFGPYLMQPTLNKMKKFCSSNDTFYAISGTGDLYTWGYGNFGKLGMGIPFPTSLSTPTKLVNCFSTPIINITCGKNHILCIDQCGVVYTWGSGIYGQLGADTNDMFRPTPIPFFKDIKCIDIAAGENHTLVLTETGDVYSCGQNWFGQLGYTTPNHSNSTPTKVMLSSSTSAKMTREDQVYLITATSVMSAVVTIDGRVFYWGLCIPTKTLFGLTSTWQPQQLVYDKDQYNTSNGNSSNTNQNDQVQQTKYVIAQIAISIGCIVLSISSKTMYSQFL